MIAVICFGWAAPSRPSHNLHKHFRAISNRPGVPCYPFKLLGSFPGLHPLSQSILPSPSALIRVLCSFNDKMSNCQIFLVLKLKISVLYINDIASSDILIRPSLASSPRTKFKSASFTPVHLLSLLRSILPPLLVRIQRIRSRGDCGPVILSLWTLAWVSP